MAGTCYNLCTGTELESDKMSLHVQLEALVAPAYARGVRRRWSHPSWARAPGCQNKRVCIVKLC